MPAKSTRAAEPRETARRNAAQQETAQQTARREGVTVTIPRTVVDAAAAPFAIAGRVLPAKKGLPVYVGLGVLAAGGAIGWPVAAGIGVAYASIRRYGGRQQPEHGAAPKRTEGERGGPKPSRTQRETAAS
ncbi:hypothetical protein GCM10009678_46150 [Actinomadura kijaniata]|uniref:Uncharacterized protein n=1 Tax=Actinomadura namibiensis TaxID=182080 RepID=A0A7W3QQP2_ACTNM|nr:hypothetical protein [Actinomadura namibiensis]MBA8955930.1 hypothetical protein [Actinomadura namibiensis]